MARRKARQERRKGETTTSVRQWRVGPSRRGAFVHSLLRQDADGTVVKYSLAFVDPRNFGPDNGRVLGYDNDHGHHHRHFFGKVEPYDFKSYEDLVQRFEEEVRRLLDEDQRPSHPRHGKP